MQLEQESRAFHLTYDRLPLPELGSQVGSLAVHMANIPSPGCMSGLEQKIRGWIHHVYRPFYSSNQSTQNVSER